MNWLLVLLIDPILESILVFNLRLHDCLEICFIGLFGWLEVLLNLIHHFVWTSRLCCFCSDNCDRLIVNGIWKVSFLKEMDSLQLGVTTVTTMKIGCLRLIFQTYNVSRPILGFDCCDFWPIRGWLQNGLCGQIVSTRTSQPSDFYQQFIKWLHDCRIFRCLGNPGPLISVVGSI